MILDDEMIITTDSGEEKVMKILFTYESEQRNKSYVFLYEKDDEENVLVFSVNESDNSLEEIEDDEEYNEAEETCSPKKKFLYDCQPNEKGCNLYYQWYYQ